MSKLIELHERISEIAERMEKDMPTGEIIAEYVPKWSVSERTIERYIALAKDIIAGKLRKQAAWIEAMRAEAIEAATEHLASNLEIEARLCQIVSGTYETDKVVPGKNGEFVKVACNPAPRDAMKAAEMLFKMRKEKVHEAKKWAEEEDDALFRKELGDKIAGDFLAQKAVQRKGEEI